LSDGFDQDYTAQPAFLTSLHRLSAGEATEKLRNAGKKMHCGFFLAGPWNKAKLYGGRTGIRTHNPLLHRSKKWYNSRVCTTEDGKGIFMGKKLNPLLDPRGLQERPVIRLAPRTGIEELKSKKILFYNNTKLGFCNYDEVFVRIKERFREIGIANFVDYTETVRGKDTKALEAYAAMLAEEKPAAAVVALGDMGTSPATCIVTIALEKLGIPSVYITAPPGGDLVEGVAVYRAGNLCLCKIDIYQASTREEIRHEIDQKWNYIMNSLTAGPERLKEAARIDYKMDRIPPAQNGLLPLTDSLEIRERALYEPGCYMEEIMDYLDREHIGDGLPVIPPTQSRLDKMYAFCPFDPGTVLCREVGPTGKDITVKDIAVASVMAGCKPTAMPILVTAFKALADPGYNLLQSVTTSHPGGNLVLVSGPIGQEIGISGKQGCLGPGYPANATIGRAVNLVILNVCRAVPGICDLDCIASQAEFTYCFAEEPELAQWEMINEERYDAETTTVYVLKAEPQHDIIDFLSLDGHDLLDTITDSCTTLGSNNAYIPGPLVLVLTPDHGMMLRNAGYTKDAIREHIHLRAVHDAPMVRNRGLVPVRPPDFVHKHPMPVTRTPKDVEIVVAGGRGGHSGVILPWALHSESIVLPVSLPDGTRARSIEEFRK
jgi:tRNA A37 threonylcarbamoyladenosine biosynthesis protein TsaE